MTNLNTIQKSVDVPEQWERCEIHNFGENPMQIYFLFDKAQKTVLFEVKKDSNGNEFVIIKPLSATGPGADSYRQAFDMLSDLSPEAEIIFY